jgi:2-methylcitrate dehydratase PrpD
MHGSLGATASLLDRVAVEEIDEICVTVPGSVVAVICEPVADKQAPRSDYDGKFSVQYSTAAMLLHHGVNLDTFTNESRSDPDVLALARKVRYEAKSYETEGAAFPGGVRIRTADGTVHEADLPYQLGAPQNPMTEGDLRAKFRDNASLLLDEDTVERIEEQICTLERQEDLEAVFSLTAAREAAV